MTRSLLQLVLRHTADGPRSDADLLGRFVAARDEAAFTALVRRHGPMVWAVCRQSVPNRADAEDAFQAVFLALAKSAAAVRRPDHLAGWLHGAAVRVAAKAKRSFQRRKMHEYRTVKPESDNPVSAAGWDDMLAAVHTEVANLPPSLRAAFVLCDLEGVEPADAAARLGLKANTLSGQLARARQRLLAALSRRGIGAGLAAVGTAAVVPQALANRTAGVIGVSPAAAIIELATGVTAMSVSKLKLLAAGLLVAGGLTVSGVGLWSKAEAQGPPPPGGFGGPGIPPPRSSGASAGGTGTGAPDGGGAGTGSPDGAGMPPGVGGPGVGMSGMGGGAGGMMGGTPAPRAAFEYLFVAKPGTLPEVASVLRGKAAQNWEYTGPLDVDPSDPKGLRGVEGVTKDTRVVLVFKRAPVGMPGMGGMGGGMMPPGMGSPGGGIPGGFGGMGGPGPGGMGGGLGGGMPGRPGVGNGGAAGGPGAPGMGGMRPGAGGLPGFGGAPGGAGGTGSSDGGRAPGKATKVFRLKHKAADEVAKEVMTAYTDAEGKALGKDLSVDSDPRTNSLVVAGTPDQIHAIERCITKIDVPPGEMYEVIPLKNANAEDVAKVLSEVFNGPDGKGDRVAVIAEKKSNAVVVTKASAADLKTIKELVKNAVDVKGVGGR